MALTWQMALVILAVAGSAAFLIYHTIRVFFPSDNKLPGCGGCQCDCSSALHQLEVQEKMDDKKDDESDPPTGHAG